ncbi:HAMP domain-containing sensor histidine kinase [Hyphomonas sp.]|uniref:sensor histidine kinase n=1 Tax=Hyphomonas sp. TaxID=87 RepID=UPI0025BED417|nr:HAMP domain-containing sensor histidine kinase [Hyphomonas sp.]
MNDTADLPPPALTKTRAGARWFDSLSFRLFGLTILAILVVEAFIFVPSASGFRTSWLTERVQAARIASLALEAAPDRSVSEELSAELLKYAEVWAVTEMEDDMRFQLLPAQMPLDGDMHMLDLREATSTNRVANTFGAFFAPDDRVLVVTAQGVNEDRVIEVLMPHAPMKFALLAYARRIAALSLLIALAAATIIYVLLHLLVVRPMQRVTLSVEQFRMDPGSWTRRLPHTKRRDEIGRAQNALADMESAVAESFRQRSHLAELGTAVAKINHDLRNSLASAQLVSDSLARSDDVRVQKAAPRLERALTRAITLATETLDYGKAMPQPAELEQVELRQALDEAADEALAAWPSVEFVNNVHMLEHVMADPDHLHRIAANLLRNAAEAMSAAGSDPSRIFVSLETNEIVFSDTGPGMPEKAAANLFTPFAGTTRQTGSGLGLVIARELARAMGGELVLAETGPAGSVFRLTLAPHE